MHHDMHVLQEMTCHSPVQQTLCVEDSVGHSRHCPHHITVCVVSTCFIDIKQRSIEGKLIPPICCAQRPRQSLIGLPIKEVSH